jgi:hypothetical protein
MANSTESSVPCLGRFFEPPMGGGLSLVGGSHSFERNQCWLVVFRPTPLKNDGVKVSWDDYSIPN